MSLSKKNGITVFLIFIDGYFFHFIFKKLQPLVDSRDKGGLWGKLMSSQSNIKRSVSEMLNRLICRSQIVRQSFYLFFYILVFHCFKKV